MNKTFIHICEDGKQTELPDVAKPCPNCGEYHPWASENWAVDELEDDQPEDQRPRKGKRKSKQ